MDRKDLYNLIKRKFPDQTWVGWESVEKNPEVYLSQILYWCTEEIENSVEHEDAFRFLFEASEAISEDLVTKVYKYLEDRDKAMVQATLNLLKN